MGQPWSGYVGGVHLVTAKNIDFDSSPKNLYDPDNGYRDACRKIWPRKKRGELPAAVTLRCVPTRQLSFRTTCRP